MNIAAVLPAGDWLLCSPPVQCLQCMSVGTSSISAVSVERGVQHWLDARCVDLPWQDALYPGSPKQSDLNGR